MDVLESNKQLYRRLAEEVLNKKNLAAIDDLLASDFAEHPGGQRKQVGPEGFRENRKRRIAAFPDWNVVIDDLIAEGDKVVVRATGRGTHAGEFNGIAPTGKRISVTWIAIYRVVNGKLAEHWQNIDDLGLMKQLGAQLVLPK